MSRQQWNPWDIQTEGPPCKHCIFWRPQFKYFVANGKEIKDGFVGCTAEEMFRDFSCFRDASSV